MFSTSSTPTTILIAQEKNVVHHQTMESTFMTIVMRRRLKSDLRVDSELSLLI